MHPENRQLQSPFGASEADLSKDGQAQGSGGESLSSPRRIDLLDGMSDGDVIDVAQDHMGTVEERDGLIWKELLVTGNWPGNEDIPPLTITLEMLEQMKEAFDAGALAHVDVPVGGEHELDAVERNSGFVRAMEVRSGYDGQYSLWVGIRFTDPFIEMKVRDGSIANVSARLQKSFTDPVTGKTWPLVLWHVALTNKPVLKGLKPFVAVSLGSLSIKAYRSKEVAMAEKQNSQDKTQTPQKTGTPEALSEQELERVRQEERERARREVEVEYAHTLTDVRGRLEQAERLAKSHRSQLHQANVKQILLALQGRGEHERVKLLPGHAFAPVVVKEVQPLLESDVGEETAIKLSVGGQERQYSVTELVLNLLNAVAKAGDGAVISLSSHGAQAHTPPGAPTEEDKDKQVDSYLKERGLAPVEDESS